MKYALNLGEDGRILSVTYEKYASGDTIFVEELPAGNVTDYLYMEGEFQYKPETEQQVEEMANPMDALEAQVIYTAMMTDTLLEV